MTIKLTLDCPAVYQIEIQGYLDESRSEWFDNMSISSRISPQGDWISQLTGTVVDQAALHGLLLKLYDLGLPLLSVNYLKGNIKRE